METRMYHWKHGWIPLDHYAAMKKSKGSELGARRYLAGSHAAGHAHESVIGGQYGGGTHVRGLQPVAAGHLPREQHITAAFNPDSRRFALHDAKGQRIGLSNEFDGKPIATSIPEHLAEHLQSRGHTIVGIKTNAAGETHVNVRTKAGDLKGFKADGSNINQVDPQVMEPPNIPNAPHAPGDATSGYVATHTVKVSESSIGGRQHGVIRSTNARGMSGIDIINADLANHINDNHYKVIGYERRVVTTVGPDGVIRRFKADGSNMHKPVIAKSGAGTLRDIGEWKAVHPKDAIPASGPVGINAVKVQRAYTRGNKTVLIEPKMSEGETEAFLNHVGQAFDVTHASTDHPVTVHVPSGDRQFRSGRTHGYVYRGDSTRVHIAPSVAKASADHRAQGEPGNWLMSAGQGVHPTLYTLTHEIGHTVDNRHGHTFDTTPAFTPSGLNISTMTARADAALLHREQITNLSTYGRSKPVEGYAEAFAHHHLAPHSTAPTDAGHNLSAAAYAQKYGWGNVVSWRSAPDSLIQQAARNGDASARNEALRRGLSI